MQHAWKRHIVLAATKLLGAESTRDTCHVRVICRCFWDSYSSLTLFDGPVPIIFFCRGRPLPPPPTLQMANSRKEDMVKNTSPEYVDEISKDLLKWHSASNRGVLR